MGFCGCSGRIFALSESAFRWAANVPTALLYRCDPRALCAPCRNIIYRTCERPVLLAPHPATAERAGVGAGRKIAMVPGCLSPRAGRGFRLRTGRRNERSETERG